MDDSSAVNKKAWEYRAYEFWNMSCGTPAEKAAQILQNPSKCLRYHQKFFKDSKGKNIANPCGSNGRIAVPLALLGAHVSIFDISEENKQYALELAEAAGVSIDYIVGDFYDIEIQKYREFFDVAYMEGGILHYFHDIDRFAGILYQIVRPKGELILSDFHPFRKIIQVGQIGKSAEGTEGDYFDSGIYSGSVAYQNYFSKEEQANFPQCSMRFYTIGEILNSFIHAGFTISEFEEHPNWEDEKIPGEFTLYAIK